MSFEILKSIEKRGKAKGEPAYIEFIKKDKNPLAGTIKKRLISSPNKAMYAINEMFYTLLRFKFKKSGVKFPFCTAVFPGSKPLKNVLKHTNAKNRYFYLIDIKDFYPSVKIHHVVQALNELAPSYIKSDELAEFLKKYCFDGSGRLRIGSPAAPDLANLTLAVFVDRKLAEICNAYHLTYTRYLDDLTFSAKRRFGKVKREKIRRVIEESGFEISHKKTVIADIRKTPIMITGIGIATDGRIFVRRGFLRKIIGLMHLINSHQLQVQLSFNFAPKKKRAKDPVNIVKGLISAFWATIPPRKGRPLNELEKKTMRDYLFFAEKYRGRRKRRTRMEKKMLAMLKDESV